MKNFLIALSLFFFLNFSAQDYEWLKLNRFKSTVLSDSLEENSGLEFHRNKLYTFNDSGNTSEIFEIDKDSGKIRKILRTNLKNIDWEAIASDSANLYIGDIGNNSGTRKDLRIYQIPFRDSLHLNSIKSISYFYPEQKIFVAHNLNTDFDAETLIYLNGKIHLFTKEWASKGTTHYVIDPENTDKQPALKTEDYPIGYAVTDAAYFDQKLYLIGYTKKTEVFLSVFTESTPGIFFQTKPQKYYLGSSLSVGQIEGIAVDESGVYISGEEFVTPLGRSKPRLYFIPADRFR
ncbi:hypothetical protein L0B70_12410 [Kaistella sp. 97-N-M2]|uniref:hypothetical protein n=1 Tax=Kaistella sp. 97-N-M2 TaxID=2908645 RepID=UPI001F2FBE26|nr:hypothetical protein [Kaistella sp. 97-N-M2]UJF29624.1 hypothetical protein L0B70_12410 [Kaistella sp. 97-N-M2]